MPVVPEISSIMNQNTDPFKNYWLIVQIVGGSLHRTEGQHQQSVPNIEVNNLTLQPGIYKKIKN